MIQINVPSTITITSHPQYPFPHIPQISVYTNWKTQVVFWSVVHLLMGHTWCFTFRDCWDLSLVTGLEAKMGGGCGA